MNNAKSVIFFATAAVWIALDQLSKLWVRANIVEHTGEIRVIPGFFSLVHAENPAAAFGALGGFQYRQLVFLAFTLVAVGVIVDLWRKLKPHERFMPFVLGLILSGAIGNAIDRVVKQEVTDFLRMYVDYPESLRSWAIHQFGTNEWPSYNIADSCLVVGVLLFLTQYLFAEEEAPIAPPVMPPDA